MAALASRACLSAAGPQSILPGRDEPERSSVPVRAGLVAGVATASFAIHRLPPRRRADRQLICGARGVPLLGSGRGGKTDEGRDDRRNSYKRGDRGFHDLSLLRFACLRLRPLLPLGHASRTRALTLFRGVGLLEFRAGGRRQRFDVCKTAGAPAPECPLQSVHTGHKYSPCIAVFVRIAS